jgi:uncharacterized lipoprotein YmbA
MKALRMGTAWVCLVCLPGCATHRDHFYVLDAQPPGGRESTENFRLQVTLAVTVPSMVDRGEMVLTTADGVTVLEHERWAAPLADLITGVLGKDIERRRADAVVLTRRAGGADLRPIKMAVDVDQVTLRLNEPVGIEVHWRITDASSGHVSVGRGSFTSPVKNQSNDYTAVAAGFSACIGLLADRLSQELPPP